MLFTCGKWEGTGGDRLDYTCLHCLESRPFSLFFKKGVVSSQAKIS